MPRPCSQQALRWRQTATDGRPSCARHNPRLPCPRGDRRHTDWIAIAAYYQALALAAPSPIIEINRAVAVGMAFGPAQGLTILDALRDEPRLQGSHLLPIVRGDLLEKLGRVAEARAQFRLAAELTGNDRERALLLARASDLDNSRVDRASRLGSL